MPLTGPLRGVRVVEMASIATGAFAGMMLADMGADVVRVDRPGPAEPPLIGSPETEILQRGRRAVAVDLKSSDGRALVLALGERADVLIEAYRPGVMERLGLGPDDCRAVNPKLVYGRVTGWGQDGPLARVPGHDINYIALAGALAHIGRAGYKPAIPLSTLGDMAGAGLFLTVGILGALFEAQRSGEGQVIDAAMVDGTALLMASIAGYRAAGDHVGPRGTNLLDGGAPFYDVYETADGGYVSVGSTEPRFHAELCRLLDIDPGDGIEAQYDGSTWPERQALLGKLFKTRARQEWCDLLEGTDACFAPVLTLEEAPHHPHLAARATFVDHEGVMQPAPAPRFGRTPGAIAGPPPLASSPAGSILAEWSVPA